MCSAEKSRVPANEAIGGQELHHFALSSRLVRAVNHDKVECTELHY